MRIPLMLSFFALSSPSMAAEYRRITLADGRVLPAEISSITATEMVPQTPQGTVIVSPNDLRDMSPM